MDNTRVFEKQVLETRQTVRVHAYRESTPCFTEFIAYLVVPFHQARRLGRCTRTLGRLLVCKSYPGRRLFFARHKTRMMGHLMPSCSTLRDIEAEKLLMPRLWWTGRLSLELLPSWSTQIDSRVVKKFCEGERMLMVALSARCQLRCFSVNIWLAEFWRGMLRCGGNYIFSGIIVLGGTVQGTSLGFGTWPSCRSDSSLLGRLKQIPRWKYIPFCISGSLAPNGISALVMVCIRLSTRWGSSFGNSISEECSDVNTN